MEGDDDELEDSDCRKTYVVSSYFAHVLTRRGVYSRAAFISLSAFNCAVFIQGQRLFEDGVYSRKYGKLFEVKMPSRTNLPYLH